MPEVIIKLHMPICRNKRDTKRIDDSIAEQITKYAEDKDLRPLLEPYPEYLYSISDAATGQMVGYTLLSNCVKETGATDFESDRHDGHLLILKFEIFKGYQVSSACSLLNDASLT